MTFLPEFRRLNDPSQREDGDRRATNCMRSESPGGIGVRVVTFDKMEAGLKARLEALPLAARAELLHILRLPDFDRVDRIGTFWGHPETRTFGELLIDVEEDKAARAVGVGMLREMERK